MYKLIYFLFINHLSSNLKHERTAIFRSLGAAATSLPRATSSGENHRHSHRRRQRVRNRTGTSSSRKRRTSSSSARAPRTPTRSPRRPSRSTRSCDGEVPQKNHEGHLNQISKNFRRGSSISILVFSF